MIDMQAVIYCRVSTQEQTHNLSIPTQLAACRAYCLQHGLAVAEEFIDSGESAKTADRPQLQAVLSFCRQNKGSIHALIVYNLSRFSRDQFQHAVIRAQLRKFGVTLRSVCEPIDDTSTGRLMEGVVSAFAQFDNDQKSERTTAGMQAALKLGRFTFKAPLGYLNTGPKSTPSLTPDPERAEVVRFAFAQVASGEPVADVLRKVSAAGLRAQRGGPLSLQTFRAMLRNPIYAGRISIPKWGVDQPGDFDALVPETVYRRVQLHLSTATGQRPKSHVRDRDDFPLRRFLRCSGCRRPLTASASTGRSGKYAYYHCPKCRGVRARREDVEAAFLAHLEALQPQPRFLRLFREIVLDVWKAEQQKVRDVKRVKAARVAELEARLERLDEAFIYERSIPQTVYERQRDRLQQDMAIAELELDDARIDQWDVEGILAFAEHLIGNVARVWLEGNLQQRQSIQTAIFPEGLPFDGRQFGTAQTCLLFNRLQAVEGSAEGVASPTGFEPVF